MKNVVLIGTDHGKFQMAKRDTNEAHLFYSTLIEQCSTHHIVALAEEMDVVALQKRGVDNTVAHRVAIKLGLNHQYSDAPPDIRRKLGIAESTQQIQINGFYNNSSPEQIEAEIRKSNEVREKYWLERLNEANQWPVLFVCGAFHVKSFSELMRRDGIDVTVAFEDWTP